MDVISDVSIGTEHATSAVSPFNARWDMVKQSLGVSRNEDVAAITGIPLRTLDRLFERPSRSLIRNMLALTAATGITLEELVAVKRAPALSRAA